DGHADQTRAEQHAEFRSAEAEVAADALGGERQGHDVEAVEDVQHDAQGDDHPLVGMHRRGVDACAKIHRVSSWCEMRGGQGRSSVTTPVVDRGDAESRTTRDTQAHIRREERFCSSLKKTSRWSTRPSSEATETSHRPHSPLRQSNIMSTPARRRASSIDSSEPTVVVTSSSGTVTVNSSASNHPLLPKVS